MPKPTPRSCIKTNVPRAVYKKDLIVLEPVNTSDAKPVPIEITDRIIQAANERGGAYEPPEDERDAVGRTMFDTPHSEDNLVTVLMPQENIRTLPSQALVRIVSKTDQREYIGIVVAGPFAEPDGLRADAPLVVTTTVRGIFMPRYHGRVHVEILREITDDGTALPPRFRPLPNSPVFVLSQEQTAETLQLLGNVRLGLAIGHEGLVVSIPADKKTVLPRHTAILGTTGGGKSTTVSGLIHQFQIAGLATIIFDTEGEYTEIVQPTEDERMRAALKHRGLVPDGVKETRLLHLLGRDTTNPRHPRIRTFGLSFEQLSPSAVIEILDLNEAQQTRFLAAYDAARQLLRNLNIFPRRNNADDEQLLAELDDQERGYPELTLHRFYDVVHLLTCMAGKESPPRLLDPDFQKRGGSELTQMLKTFNVTPDHAVSWRTLLGKLGRLQRLDIFDNPKAPAPDFEALLTPGFVTIIDLSDTDSPEINNLVIASFLRGIQTAQEKAYEQAVAAHKSPPRTVIIIEEAHEFLSTARIQQMPTLFQQVARIARRGRKRWLGLVFVTQLPQHLPGEVLGLTNNFILHKIGDSNVISTLRRSIGGIDDALWERLHNLSPGQAIVSMGSLTRPLLVSIDPTPSKLRMID